MIFVCIHYLFINCYNNNLILIPLALKCSDNFWVAGDQGHQTLFSLIQFSSNHCEGLLDIILFSVQVFDNEALFDQDKLFP